ncbi:dienelactone hydrolase family protein [Actinomarinicola tropica]|nr:alpha/beta fold hydrolase [Actinomarinicola tropica]
MESIEETVTEGVVRRRFDLEVEGRQVPGIRWAPEGAEPTATILVGHGGFQSKEAPNIVEMAAQLAHECGYATIALDAPGHGERRTEEQIRQQEEVLRRLREGGVDEEMRRGRERVVDEGTRTGSDDSGPARPPRMVREWRALLDALEGSDPATGPYGYWGVSMGARYGIPLVAIEPRIRCAVLGLFGLGPDPAFRATVESITIPLLFLFQYDDELMTPESGLALWAAFGSEEKTMHINPGPHVGIPVFERDASAAFYRRHLG